MRVGVFRTIAVCLVLAAAGAAGAFAQDSTTTDPTVTDPGATTEPTTTTAPEPPPPEPPPPEPALIREGVTIAGLAVGGMTAEEAAAAVYSSWRQPLVWTFRNQTRTPSATRVGASTDISGAVTRALAAAPFEAVTLPLVSDRATLRRHVPRLPRGLHPP